MQQHFLVTQLRHSRAKYANYAEHAPYTNYAKYDTKTVDTRQSKLCGFCIFHTAAFESPNVVPQWSQVVPKWFIYILEHLSLHIHFRGWGGSFQKQNSKIDGFCFLNFFDLIDRY